MKRPALAVVATALCFATGPAAPPIHGAADARTFSILQSELQRNFQILKKQESPAYFIAYTVHDSHSAILEASIGALQRSDESHNRFATVEVRVGDYFLDNTHPVRGDNRAPSPRVSQIALPLTDEEKPIRLALWRATDRTFKQASEALTRVKTNVAAKVKEEDPAPDFSREDPQTYNGEPASYSLDTKAWEGRLRRISAPFADDPLVFRSEVSLSVEANNRYYVNSEGSQVATGEDEQINQASALWARPKSEITEAQYHEFYKHVAHDFEPPLAYTHSKIEGRQEYTQLLFIPQRAPYDLWDREHRHGIKLYIRRVFIMDDAEQLLPAYLRFIRGVIDSSDLPLNVSREILQQSKDVEAIRNASVKRVLALLEDLAEHH